MTAALLLLAGPTASHAEPQSTGSRALELVTPSDPIAATIASLSEIAPKGGAMVYATIGPVPGAVSGDLIAHGRATRGQEGWRTSAISAPYVIRQLDFSTVFGIDLAASGEDLISFVLGSRVPLLPGAPEGRLGLYRLDADDELSLLADLGPKGSFSGASADTSHVIFSSAEHLLPGDAGRTEGESAYESVNGGLRQVDVASDGSLLSACGSSVPDQGAVSRSGDRVFFLNPVSCGGEPTRLYLRESGARTVEVSASRCQRPDCGPVQAVAFAGANPSGSVAFLTTEQQLTDADLDAGRDLYRFDALSESLELVSTGSAAMEGTASDRQVLSSADGSRVYFYAEGRLLPGQGDETGTNLYLSEEGELRFLAAVGFEDTLEISADGRRAALTTASQLVPVDDDGRVDVYLYDVSAGDFTRLSVGSSGGNGPFDATTQAVSDPLGSQPPSSSFAEDGTKAFFESAEALVGTDGDGSLDVYGWEAGSGLSLISTGDDDDPAELAGASADGRTVVFRTAASLLPQDRDGGDLDLYASVAGGGFEEVAAATPTCDPCVPRPEPLVRPAAASSFSRLEARRGRIRLLPLDRDAGRQLVEGGRAILMLSVPAPGKVTARGHAVLGGASRAVAHGVAGAVRAGSLRLSLRLSEGAQRALRRAGELRVRLALQQGDVHLTRVLTVRLGAAR